LTTDALLHISPYVTANNLNFTRCNPTAGAIWSSHRNQLESYPLNAASHFSKRGRPGRDMAIFSGFDAG